MPEPARRRRAPAVAQQDAGGAISFEALIRARRRREFLPFAAPEHPPHVTRGLAADASIAMDEAIGTSFSWANAALQSSYDTGLIWPGYAELALLAQRPEFRVIVETLAYEATREWVELKSTGDDEKTDQIKQLSDALDYFDVKRVCRRVSEHDGFFGRGHIFLDSGDTDDGDELKLPIGNGRNALSRAKINPDHQLKNLLNVEPIWAYPTRYNSTDPLKLDWYRPEHWFVMGREVHRSRLLTLVAREVPDILKPAYSFGGLSMTQMVKPTVDNWLKTRDAVTDLIQAFSMFVLSTDMNLVNQKATNAFFERIDFFNEVRTNRGLMVLNKTKEELDNVSAPLGGLADLQAKAQEQMCSISRTPVVKLLGIQPSGLNASSEGELKSWEDWVAAYQEAFYRKPLTTIIDFIQLSMWGKIDPEIIFAFKPLRQTDPIQEADIHLRQAQTDQIYATIGPAGEGAVSAQEIREKLASDEDSPYQGLDLSRPLPEPEPMLPPMPGMPGMPEPPRPEGERPEPHMPHSGGAPPPIPKSETPKLPSLRSAA